MSLVQSLSQVEIKVSATVPISSEAQGPLPSSLVVGRILFLAVVGLKFGFLVRWPPGVALGS